MRKLLLSAVALVALSSAASANMVSGVPNWYVTGGGCFHFTIQGDSTVYVIPRSDEVFAGVTTHLGIGDGVGAVQNAVGVRTITFEVVNSVTCQGDSTPSPWANFFSPN